MGKAIEINDSNFDEIVGSGKPVLIDFWAQWCGPCKAIAPIIEELAEEVGETAIVGKVDVDANPTIAQKYMITSIPMIMIFKDGEVVDKHLGLTSKPVLAKKLDAALVQA